MRLSWDHPSLQRGAIRLMSVCAVLIAALAPSQTLFAAMLNPAVVPDLTSNADRMISYRHQERMWQTADGGLHLIINRGSLQPAPGLALYTSYDAGLTWQLMQVLGNTDSSSTADGALDGNTLSLVYATSGATAIFAQLSYDEALHTWTVLRSETAYAEPGIEAINPTLAVDAQGTVWCAFVAREKRSRLISIRLVDRTGGGNVWTDTGLTFGAPDTSKEHSARPIRITSGMGMVFRVGETTYWATRSDDLPYNSAWTIVTAHSGATQRPLADPYASHFSVITDDQYNVHMVVVNNANAYYLRLLNGDTAWSTPLQLDGKSKAGYVQIGLTNANIVVGMSTDSGAGALVMSANLGTTFSKTHDLAVPVATSGVSYKTPRLEMPGRSIGNLPILQQYEDNNVQRLMLFTAPAP